MGDTNKRSFFSFSAITQVFRSEEIDITPPRISVNHHHHQHDHHEKLRHMIDHNNTIFCDEVLNKFELNVRPCHATEERAHDGTDYEFFLRVHKDDFRNLEEVCHKHFRLYEPNERNTLKIRLNLATETPTDFPVDQIERFVKNAAAQVKGLDLRRMTIDGKISLFNKVIESAAEHAGIDLEENRKPTPWERTKAMGMKVGIRFMTGVMIFINVMGPKTFEAIMSKPEQNNEAPVPANRGGLASKKDDITHPGQTGDDHPQKQDDHPQKQDDHPQKDLHDNHQQSHDDHEHPHTHEEAPEHDHPGPTPDASHVVDLSNQAADHHQTSHADYSSTNGSGNPDNNLLMTTPPKSQRRRKKHRPDLPNENDGHAI